MLVEFHRILPTHALGLSACPLLSKKKSLRAKAYETSTQDIHVRRDEIHLLYIRYNVNNTIILHQDIHVRRDEIHLLYIRYNVNNTIILHRGRRLWFKALLPLTLVQLCFTPRPLHVHAYYKNKNTIQL